MPGADPDRASYQIAVEAAQNLVTTAAGITRPDGDLAGDIGRAVLSNLHGPRRPRVCARKVKSPLSRWNKHPEGKPRTAHRIADIGANPALRTGPAPWKDLVNLIGDGVRDALDVRLQRP